MSKPLASVCLASLLASWFVAGCSGTPPADPGKGGSGGAPSSQGGTAPSSGGSSSGGASSGGGVQAGASSGGSSNGGSGGGSSGAGMGGSSGGSGGGSGAAAGGTAAGNTATGGTAAGGAATGGSSKGGAAAGGAANGGSATGGAGKGGSTSGGAANGGSGGAASVTWPVINGVQWADTSGNPIQAHGGGMLKVDGYYYWFGENRNPDGTFYAVSAYRSQDLMRWEFVNHVLRETSGPGLDPANIERPKVVFNASTNKYVMWMHWENGMHYGEARAAVASSSTVTGDYTYHGSERPLVDSGVVDHDRPGYMSRDCTLFVDDDGKAYFLSATNENYDLNLYLLTPDYLKIDRLVTVLFKGGHREAPALFKRNGVYFLLTSGATGWSPNQAQYATSKSISSGWSAMTNVGDNTTYHSQSTYVLPIQGTAGTAYLYLGDRWGGAWSGSVNESMYVWQPISFPSATSMSMSWNNTFSIDAGAGTISAATRNFRFVNVKSGKTMEVAGASTADGADIVQNPESSADSQVWSLNYNAAGYFRLTNVRSSKILEVPDESTNDGVALKQWQNNNGDHQVWRIVDLGNGRFKLRNKKSAKFVGVVAGSTANAAAVEQRTGTTGEEQQWRIVAVP